MRRLLLYPICTLSLLAQQVVAPTPERTGRARGENVGDYNVVQSFELGYRFREVDGNLGKYRSDVNYGNGIRLLSSYLTVHSREGQGRYFDELVLSTQGLGNDPYQSVTLRVHKNRLYDYNFGFRLNEYYNPALTISNGQHFRNTANRWQDHNLTLLPDGKFHLLAGFTRFAESGPGLSTTNVQGTSGDEFLLFTDVRRQWTEYRLGADAQVGGMKLSVVRSWQYFKDDTPNTFSGATTGNNPADSNTLTSFQRSEPYHGRAPSWRVGLFGEQGKWFSYNGRFTYTEGLRQFFQNESALGAARFSSINRQVLIGGDAQRPILTGNLNLTLFPTDRLTVTNHTAFYRIRMDGQNTYQEFNNQTLSFRTLNFQFLGLRTVSNSTDLDYKVAKSFSAFASYQVTTRQVRSIEQSGDADFSFRDEYRQNNILHAGRLGFRWRPIKPLSFTADGEIGRANRPFLPTSERNYHAVGLRAQYRTRTLSFTAAARLYSNFNAVPETAYSLRNKTYSGDVAWTPREWLSFDLSYSKLRMNTASGLAYFVDFALINGEQSLYISNLHFGNASVRFGFKKKGDLYLGYSRVQDTGDGRSTAAGNGQGTALPALQLVQTFPLAFESPLVRYSLPLKAKLRWNLGYQFYHYREDFSTRQNYRAHTGYSSVSWSF